MRISPSETWSMDFVEIYNLLDVDEVASTDLSIGLAFRRKLNGASKEWQQKS